MAEPQGNPPPNGGQGSDPPEGSDQPKHVTQEQIETIVKNSMNSAITSRLSEFEKRQKNSLTQILAERDKGLMETFGTHLATTLDEKLAALKPKEEEPKPKGNETATPPQSKPEDSPAFKALMKKLELLEQKNAESETKAREAEAKRRDTELRTSVLKLLNVNGIIGERADLALGVLVDAKKLVGYQPDSDEIVFKSGEEALPIADGLKSWIKTDQAQIFLPPKDIKGSGDRPSGGGGGGGSDPNNPLAKLGQQLVQHLRVG
ncbi:hypothetical protein [Sorangium sp. So ce233]|uniref:hypothetical protein n=1 Tax=Sorangium sp. So ce233 TaxID=3133290 RepID=UPI003F5E58EB